MLQENPQLEIPIKFQFHLLIIPSKLTTQITNPADSQRAEKQTGKPKE